MAALASSLLRRGKLAARHASEAPGGAIRSAAPRRARCRVAAAAAAGGGAAEGGGGRHVVVAGGGAAGLTAAYFAAARGARVTVLEKMSETGKKILISGGSRCNVLPSEVSPRSQARKYHSLGLVRRLGRRRWVIMSIPSNQTGPEPYCVYRCLPKARRSGGVTLPSRFPDGLVHIGTAAHAFDPCPAFTLLVLATKIPRHPGLTVEPLLFQVCELTFLRP